MKKILDKLLDFTDDLTIRKKMLLVYIFCMLIPLFLTDGAIIYTVFRTEQQLQSSEMEDIAEAVRYQIFYDVDSVSRVAKSIYTNSYIDEFLEREYADPLDYVLHYQQFFKDTLFNSGDMTGNSVITLYTDNDSVVSGGTVRSIEQVRDSMWYRELVGSGADQLLYFDYESEVGTASLQRHVYFVRNMNYFGGEREKALKIELNYTDMAQTLNNMNYDMPVYVLWNDRVIFSNSADASIAKPYEMFAAEDQVKYSEESSIYGAALDIAVLAPVTDLQRELLDAVPLFLLLILVNLILPILLILILNRSLTERISRLREIFQNTEDENLVEIEDVSAADEIGDLMRSYNKMAARIRMLVGIVYKNRIREQEMTVARQKAEVLALRSQINPHFLFNALESIRMHSILRREITTADMVEKLAVMQRQYVDWGEDLIEVAGEMENVRNYLDLQQYRFGDRLSYDLDVEEDCLAQRIPKLTIVTFAENACVHGIECKPDPGWVFVRVFREKEKLCIEVEDTGAGMSGEESEKMQARMNSASIEMLENEKSVGIVNACLRLKMASDGHAEFEVSAEEGMGVSVLIRIPYDDTQKSRSEGKGGKRDHAESSIGG